MFGQPRLRQALAFGLRPAYRPASQQRQQRGKGKTGAHHSGFSGGTPLAAKPNWFAPTEYQPLSGSPVNEIDGAAAVLIALQLGATHWFYFYVVWFLPLVLAALFAAQPGELSRSASPAGRGSAS